jgi:hypothetical protein
MTEGREAVVDADELRRERERAVVEHVEHELREAVTHCAGITDVDALELGQIEGDGRLALGAGDGRLWYFARVVDEDGAEQDVLVETSQKRCRQYAVEGGEVVDELWLVPRPQGELGLN